MKFKSGDLVSVSVYGTPKRLEDRVIQAVTDEGQIRYLVSLANGTELLRDESQLELIDLGLEQVQ